jgi:hypothetical protein
MDVDIYIPSLGILENEDDDLAELEKRLTEKAQQGGAAHSSGPSSPSHLASESEATASPRSSVTSPGLQHKEKRQEDKSNLSATPASAQGEGEVEALSEMMCSLVTNQSGETRYIGKIICRHTVAWMSMLTNLTQALHPDSPFSRQRASSGSTIRPATTPSRI